MRRIKITLEFDTDAPDSAIDELMPFVAVQLETLPDGDLPNDDTRYQVKNQNNDWEVT